MANKYISDLTAATTLAGTDEFEMDNGTNSRKITAANAAKSLQTLGFMGAMVKKSADQTGANYTTGTILTFDSEIYDVGGWHDNVTNNSRLTVPSGVNYVIVSMNLRLANVTASNTVALSLSKNGSIGFDGTANLHTTGGFTTPAASFTSGPIPVTAGDYFEVTLQLLSDVSIDVTAARTNFSIYAVG